MFRLMFLFLTLFCDVLYGILMPRVGKLPTSHTIVSEVFMTLDWCDVQIIKSIWNTTGPIAKTCDIKVVYEDTGSLQYFSKFDFTPLLCTSILDASTGVCNVVHSANKFVDINSSPSIPAAVQFCRNSKSTLTRNYPFINEAKQWLETFNDLIQNETKCMSVCVSENLINPLCSGIYILNTILQQYSDMQPKISGDAMKGNQPSLPGPKTKTVPLNATLVDLIQQPQRKGNFQFPENTSSVVKDESRSGAIPAVQTSVNKAEKNNSRLNSAVSIPGNMHQDGGPSNDASYEESQDVNNDTDDKRSRDDKQELRKTAAPKNTTGKTTPEAKSQLPTELELIVGTVPDGNSNPVTVDKDKHLPSNGSPPETFKIENTDPARDPPPGTTENKGKSPDSFPGMTENKGKSSNSDHKISDVQVVPTTKVQGKAEEPTEVSVPSTAYSDPQNTDVKESDDPPSENNHLDVNDIHAVGDDDDDDDDGLDTAPNEENVPSLVAEDIFPSKTKSAFKGLPVQDTVEESNTEFVKAEDSHFFAYFMTMIVLCIIGYLVFHNKQKILALALEGRSRRSTRRRPNTSGYRKLDSNLEEAVTSQCSSASVTHVIY